MNDRRQCPVCAAAFPKWDAEQNTGAWTVAAIDGWGAAFCCSATCRDGFLAWPQTAQLYAVFGSVGRAGWAMGRARLERGPDECRGVYVIASESLAVAEAEEPCRWQKPEAGQLAGDDRAAVEITWRTL